MTKANATKRYFAVGITKILFATTLADPEVITRAELTAALEIQDEVADISGFNTSGGTIDVPDYGRRFVAKIPGRINSEDSTLTVYADLEGDDLRKQLPRDTDGYLIFMDGGDVEDQPMDVFPVRVTSVGKVRSTGDQGFQLTIGFAITAPPAEDVEIPATA
ncbi:hypothetical protein GCM10010401_14240 [Rarobacter faecitabidus]|uniref:Uncharacterized protein n=1 Tax=Rarobacter faecitabidus TaxID=13243 RepID=A0A542ZE13_RARFA|nr:hypothetical protein [Rarobacter faecitabidus]TQL58529.1 hypothetical protein FB461_1944 [Rarobacter faecitabidus]